MTGFTARERAMRASGFYDSRRVRHVEGRAVAPSCERAPFHSIPGANMALLIALLFILLALTALVVVAAYATVGLAYWFEMRQDHRRSQDISTAR